MPGKITHCCVKKCPTNVPGHRMSVYSIPEDRSIKRQWLNAVKKATVSPSYGVCERHFTHYSFVPMSENLDSKGQPFVKNRLLPNAVPTIYLDHTSKDFKDYRAAEVAKEKQTLRRKKNYDNKKIRILKCKFCEFKHFDERLFQQHLIEAHNFSGPEDFNVNDWISNNQDNKKFLIFKSSNENQEFLNSIGVGSTISDANKFVKTGRQILPKQPSDSIGVPPPTIIKVNVGNHEKVDEVVSKIIAGSEINAKSFDFKVESIDENPWNIESLYDLQYFNCPACDFKNGSKQTFVCHAFSDHPESVEFLKNISDESLNNILCPWNTKTTDTPILTWLSKGQSNFRASKVEPNNDDIDEDDDPLKTNSESENVDSFNEINSDTFKMEVVDNLNSNAEDISGSNLGVNQTLENNVQEDSDSVESTLAVKTVHEGHKCDTCGMIFPRIKGLKMHIDRSHYKYEEKDRKTQIVNQTLENHVQEDSDSVESAIAMKTVHEGHKDFKCDICFRSFFHRKFLKIHIDTIHEGGKNFESEEKDRKTQIVHDADDSENLKNSNKCQFCGKCFENESKLKLHIDIFHEYKCESCNVFFFNKNALKKHMLTHEISSHKCPYCDQVFNEAIKLRKHFETVHEGQNKESYKCDFCEKSFGSKQILEKHTHNYHDEVHENCPEWCEILRDKVHESQKPPKDHKCENCGKSFSSKESLSTHVLGVHEGIRPYICEMLLTNGQPCGQNFTRNGDLRKHIIQIHNGEQPKNEPCHLCPTPRLFYSRFYLKEHIAMVHEGQRPNQCELCGKAFFQLSTLKKHIRNTHEGQKDYICESCGKEYTDKKHLFSHVRRVHEGYEGKDYKCEHCDKSYNNHGTLNNHIVYVHKKKVRPSYKAKKNGKVLQCDTCGRAFSSKMYLKQHVEVKHEGIRQNCEFCDKKFTSKQVLQLHVRSVHDGIKVKCDQCGKDFQSKDTLEKHIKAVHEGLKDWICKYCNKAFGHSGTLSSHVRAVHLKEPNVWKRKPKKPE